ncbi:MAG: hypothetical protein ACR5LD_11160 [Symbiopectobacterium sp.]
MTDPCVYLLLRPAETSAVAVFFLLISVSPKRMETATLAWYKEERSNVFSSKRKTVKITVFEEVEMMSC